MSPDTWMLVDLAIEIGKTQQIIRSFKRNECFLSHTVEEMEQAINEAKDAIQREDFYQMNICMDTLDKFYDIVG